MAKTIPMAGRLSCARGAAGDEEVWGASLPEDAPPAPCVVVCERTPACMGTAELLR